ncbi:hypothetical protein H4R34_000635 [Dimargaris verticillata]|uniref:CMP/dCMP-type deaminase domain-containing protein n=1 Tax=Dimargaris verticillata TaxID=2761393 RepID=A0A9W8EB39_9FUNG|nr:hypothetical protein H4R34_000635 [Dimargaris verticillata]
MATAYTPQDVAFLEKAIAEAEKSAPVPSAYCVGAVLVGPEPNPQVLSTGFSRELPGNTHAEECALQKLRDNPLHSPDEIAALLKQATMYTTMEPCSKRLSGNRTCTARILEAGIPRVVLGVKEPANFVQCEGVQLLQDGGVQVVYVPGLEERCMAPNRHII